MYPAGTPIPGIPGARLLRDLSATLSSKGSGYLMESRYLRSWGYGRTPQEAETDFLTELYDLMVTHSRYDGRLIERDQEVLDRLRRVVVGPAQ